MRKNDASNKINEQNVEHPSRGRENANKPISVWNKGIGNIYLLPGVPTPAAPSKKGQLGLPGLVY